MPNSNGRGSKIESLSLNNHRLPALNASFSCFSTNKPRNLLKRGSCSHLFVASKHWSPCNWEDYSLAGIKRSVGLSAVSPNEIDQIMSVMSTLVLSSENDPINLGFPAYDTASGLEREVWSSRLPHLYHPP